MDLEELIQEFVIQVKAFYDVRFSIGKKPFSQ